MKLKISLALKKKFSTFQKKVKEETNFPKMMHSEYLENVKEHFKMSLFIFSYNTPLSWFCGCYIYMQNF